MLWITVTCERCMRMTSVHSHLESNGARIVADPFFSTNRSDTDLVDILLCVCSEGIGWLVSLVYLFFHWNESQALLAVGILQGTIWANKSDCDHASMPPLIGIITLQTNIQWNRHRSEWKNSSLPHGQRHVWTSHGLMKFFVSSVWSPLLLCPFHSRDQFTRYYFITRAGDEAWLAFPHGNSPLKYKSLNTADPYLVLINVQQSSRFIE